VRTHRPIGRIPVGRAPRGCQPGPRGSQQGPRGSQQGPNRASYQGITHQWVVWVPADQQITQHKRALARGMFACVFCYPVRPHTVYTAWDVLISYNILLSYTSCVVLVLTQDSRSPAIITSYLTITSPDGWMVWCATTHVGLSGVPEDPNSSCGC
jgi:hypothetical protein